MKRVWCLYRVSTKQQVNTDDDIPMQRNACHNFASKQFDWVITNELYEKGVSGWSKKLEERDVLNTIKESAIKKQFDILLVFMFDRIGRREDETPLVVNFLNEQGVEVWSVQEGKRKMDSHVDKLINYISFWQSSGESIKTSIRVRESKKQLSQQGYFQGGIAPFGYEIYETETPHWKNPDRKIKDLRPNEYEANIVKLIYDLYINKNFGKRRIIKYLNENFYNRNGKKFGISTVDRILTNPIYIGYKRYKSFDMIEDGTQPYKKELQIISNYLFEKAQDIKVKRNRAFKLQDKSNIPTKGKLLFSGIIRCKYCNSKLTANYLYRKTKKKDGTENKSVIYRYTCPLNKGMDQKHDQYVWGAIKYDKIIIDEVKKLLILIDLSKFIDSSTSIKNQLLSVKIKTLKKLKVDKVKLTEEISKLNKEIVNSLSGNSIFTPLQLSNALQNTEDNLLFINKEIDKTNKLIDKIKSDISMGHENFEQLLLNWEELFDNADHDRKKVFLANIIDTIYLGKNQVSIKFNIYIEEILNKIET